MTRYDHIWEVSAAIIMQVFACHCLYRLPTCSILALCHVQIQGTSRNAALENKFQLATILSFNNQLESHHLFSAQLL